MRPRSSMWFRARPGRRTDTSALTALVLVALVGMTAPSAAGTTPGVNGRISFMRMDDTGHWQTWTANPDLTAQHKITDGDFDNSWAAWSPDGTRLAFDSSRLAPEANGDLKEIFTMAPDGTDVHQVTNLGFFAGQPTWSPDGRWIAFTTDGGDYPTSQGIYAIHPDGTGLHRIVALPAGPRSVWLDAPRFSPDGSRLAYTFFQGGKPTRSPWSWKGETSALWTVGVDGANARQVVAPGQKVGDADWSPDGRHLVFEQMGNDPGSLSRVLRVPATGGGITALSQDTGLRGGRSDNWSFQASFDPVYSPDGTTILFPHDEYSPTFGCTSLQAMNADGTNPHWVNDQCGVEHQVDWGTAPLE
ncbi:PD40 domain-containing protein [Janibacter sp. HTCC2649]|uniref:TolB family protein n=1 Tax=Janibacter sp. HTCC2649 TaxID=313589 RepID=UPI0011D17D53|nr:PD40 domain-containing protein [Janibacter sp. HTCC2649]